MIRNRYVLTLLVFVVSFCFSCGVNENTIVARVDNFVLRLGELKEQLPKNKKSENEFEVALKELQNMVNRRLKINEAYRKQIDQDDDIQARVADAERKYIYQTFIEKELIQRQIPESKLKEYYKRSAEQVRVRQVLINLGNDEDEKKVSQAYHRLIEARKKALKGKDFIEIVKEYSTDSTTIKNEGDLGFIKWGSSLYDDLLIKKAFNLKTGAVSFPFRTTRGYCLLKLEERKKISQKPFDEMRNGIRRVLFKQQRSNLEKAYFDMIDELKSEYGARFEEKNIQYLAKKVQQQLSADTLSSSQRSGNKDQFEGISEDDKGLPLISIHKGPFITIGKIIDDLRRFPPYKQPRMNTEKALKEWLDRVVPYELCIAKAYSKNLQNDPKVKEQIITKLENLILNRLETREIHDKINPHEEVFEKYYEEKREKYKRPETVKVQEVFVKDRSLGVEIATRAKRGEDFGALADKYNKRSTTKNNHGMLGYIRENQYGLVGKTAIKMNPGEIAGPIKMGKNYSIIKVLDRKPETPMTYEEAKSRVRSDLKKQMRTQRESEWLESLRTKTNVQIYEGVLKKAFPSEDI